jgi:hypothetical protein
MTSFKPAGYTSVSPYLIVSDAAATIRFLEAVFNGNCCDRFPTKAGRSFTPRSSRRQRHHDCGLRTVMAAGAGLCARYVGDVDATYARRLSLAPSQFKYPPRAKMTISAAVVTDAGRHYMVGRHQG